MPGYPQKKRKNGENKRTQHTCHVLQPVRGQALRHAALRVGLHGCEHRRDARRVRAAGAARGAWRLIRRVVHVLANPGGVVQPQLMHARREVHSRARFSAAAGRAAARAARRRAAQHALALPALGRAQRGARRFGLAPPLRDLPRRKACACAAQHTLATGTTEP